eukprot:CAMPEP_0115390506 /NCGR_PEP_ID=MMETSP0271-20121206/10236_1 /TAXON_ID=71861 /ORGANISM="Scrippsiella trochoidea, Strain CCMP3099" /LENGTH=315 /DNA_ID=CAMNT_0002814049 /DNA_START=147 /DNA_END=1095 /DNA_ORIENTATION=+
MLTIPAFACAAGSLTDADVVGCSTHPLVMLCGVNAVLAIVHLGMALYLQKRLVHGLEPGILNTHGAAADGQAPQNLSSKELMARAGQVVLYDVGFCIYVFVFFGAFVLQCTGFGWIGGCDPSSPLPYIAASLHVMFTLMAVFFGFMWWFAMMCDDCCNSWSKPAQSVAQPQRRQRRGILGTLLGFLLGNTGRRQQGPPPTVMGAPAQQQMGVPPMYHASPIPPAGYQYHMGQQQQQPVQGIPVHAQGIPEPSAPPPPQQQPEQQTAGQMAAQAAAGGIRAAGQGLQMARGWLAQKGSAEAASVFLIGFGLQGQGI